MPQLLMSCRPNIRLPIKQSLLALWLQLETRDVRRTHQRQPMHCYDQRTRHLSLLQTGNRVRIRGHHAGLSVVLKGYTVEEQVTLPSYQLQAGDRAMACMVITSTTNSLAVFHQCWKRNFPRMKHAGAGPVSRHSLAKVCRVLAGQRSYQTRLTENL